MVKNGRLTHCHLRPVFEYQQPLESQHSCSLLHAVKINEERSFKLSQLQVGKVCHRGGSPAGCTHLWKILDFLSLEKFSSCKDSWVRKATAK